MKQLFLVSTKKWKRYFVFAHDFNEAAAKLQEHLKESESIVSFDGSLNMPEEDSVERIELITDKVIR